MKRGEGWIIYYIFISIIWLLKNCELTIIHHLFLKEVNPNLWICMQIFYCKNMYHIQCFILTKFSYCLIYFLIGHCFRKCWFFFLKVCGFDIFALLLDPEVNGAIFINIQFGYLLLLFQLQEEGQKYQSHIL